MGRSQPFADGFHHCNGNAVSGLFVELCVRLNRKHSVDLFVPPALQPQAFFWSQPADSAAEKNTVAVLGGEGEHGFFRRFDSPPVLTDSFPFRGKDRTGFQGSLVAVCGEGMGDFSANSAAAGIQSGKRQTDAVAGIRHFISLLSVLLDGQAHFIQAGFPAKSTRLCRKGTAYPFRGVHSLSLRSGKDLHKRRSCCFGERKYFSSASLIKISDKIHPFSGLGDSEILAVEHLPFHTIPQSIQRMEDGRKRPAPVMIKQSGNIFKQQIRRSFCRSQPGNFKEQGTSWIVESSTVSSNRKRLAGKSAAQQVEVGDAVWIGFSDIFTKPLSFCIEQGFIALVCLFVDFAMAYAGKPSGAGEPFPEPADAGEQVNISYGFLYHAPFEGFDESLKHNQWTSPLFRELKSI